MSVNETSRSDKKAFQCIVYCWLRVSNRNEAGRTPEQMGDAANLFPEKARRRMRAHGGEGGGGSGNFSECLLGVYFRPRWMHCLVGVEFSVQDGGEDREN